jgi:hypothetical protein
MAEPTTEAKKERKNYVFISSEDTGLDVTTADGKLHRLQFENAVFQTKDGAVAEAIRRHTHFGWRFFEDFKNRKVENKFVPEKQELATALTGMSINMLRSICKEQKLMDGDWTKISATPKEDLVVYMVNHRDKLGHYATLGR